MALSVGFIGVGNMGNPMAGNVLKAGFPMLVFDLNPKAMENLIQAGARRARSAQEVVEGPRSSLPRCPPRLTSRRCIWSPAASWSAPSPAPS